MIQGISIAAQGMSTLIEKQNQIANNLANINTTGFKQSGLMQKAYQKYVGDDLLQPFANREIKADQVYIDFSEGVSRKTGSPLDSFIQGNGFFTVLTPQGIRYSRNGNFSMDNQGYLVTGSTGDRVMGTEGFIRVDTNKPVTITEQGEVISEKASKGFLKISDFKKPYNFLREGNSYYKQQLPEDPVYASNSFLIKQGFLETSNVNSIKNMTDMISTYRTYEASQKALLAQDETLDKAVNSVGKL